MHPQETVGTKEFFVKFQGMRHHFHLATFQIQNGIIKTTFQENNILDKYLFGGLVINNQQAVIALGLVGFHRFSLTLIMVFDVHAEVFLGEVNFEVG